MDDWKLPLIVAVTALLAFATIPVTCTVQERQRIEAVSAMVAAGADPLAAKCAMHKSLPENPDPVCVLTAARLNSKESIK